MVVYKITNGMAHDLRFVDAPDADDIVLPGVERLPDINTLHDAAYLAEITKKQAIDGIQSILDTKAKELGFDTIHTAAIWAAASTSPKRAARGRALAAWADDVWDFAEEEWEKQAKGEPTYTAIEDFLAALPGFGGETERRG